MSCYSPGHLPVYQPGKPHTAKYALPGVFTEIPCRVCAGCRMDRTNYWEDRLNYARLETKSSAFVTFTYDMWRVPLNSRGVATLVRDDLTRFIDRLRRQVSYHGVPSDLCDKKWSYYAVGEYGGSFLRPH